MRKFSDLFWLGIPAVLAGILALGLIGSDPLARGSVPEGSAVLEQAQRALAQGQPAEAAAALEALSGGELADHAELLRARFLEQSGDLEGAFAATRSALLYDPPSEVAAGAQHRLGLLSLKRGDLLGAYRAFRSGWETTRDPGRAAGLALEAARAFEERGLPGDAVGLYRQVWQKWPRSEEGRVARKRDQALTRGIGAEPPVPDALLEHATELLSITRCEEALEIYEDLLEDPKLSQDLRQAAERGRADCFFRTRRYPEATLAYRQIVAQRPKDDEAAIQLARSLARTGDSQLAIEKLSDITRRANEATRARARYLVALLLEDDEPETAARLFRLVEKNRRSPVLAQRARWQLAWRDVRMGRHRAAERRLRVLARGSIWDVEVQRARYWLARSRIELGGERGKVALAELAEQMPLSYYGLLAAERLDIQPELERSLLPERERVTDPSQGRARMLMAAGFQTPAREEVESWVRRGEISREERVSAAGLLHGLGDHAHAVRVVINGFGGTFKQGIDPAWRDAWVLAWPRPYGSGVIEATDEFEFDPSMVYAIMREESSYRPGVRSRADARGLMQIVPPTAKRIAAKLGVSGFDSASLYTPAINLRFGTFYLAQLVERFGGSRPLAIAAYNAGPEAVERWRNRDGKLELDLFVESVPYGETRRYLRRVLGSRQMYRLLYPQAASAVRTDGPSRP